MSLIANESYKTAMESYLQDNDIEMHSTRNKRNSVVAETFIKTLKNKIYKYMTSKSKKVYINKVAVIVIDKSQHNQNEA